MSPSLDRRVTDRETVSRLHTRRDAIHRWLGMQYSEPEMSLKGVTFMTARMISRTWPVVPRRGFSLVRGMRSSIGGPPLFLWCGSLFGLGWS